MTLHDDILGADAAEVLLDLHGESVTYRPSSGAARVVTAIVERQGRREASPGGPNPGRIVPQLMVSVLMDPDHAVFGGIDPAELNTDGDQIDVAALSGGTKRARRILRTAPNSQAGGLITLEVTS